MKITFTIVTLIILYVAIELGIFWYKAKHLPKLPSIDQSDITLGSGPILRYIAAGDSTAVGVGAHNRQNTYAYKIAENFAQNHAVEFKNIAVVGYKTEDVINKQLEQIIAYNPDIVTISMGANDATHLLSSSKILNNYKSVIQKLETQTTAKIYITNIPNFSGANVLPWFYVWLIEFRSNSLNAEIPKLENERIKIANVHDFGWTKTPNNMAADNFHPNDTGYQNWTNTFLSKINNSPNN